MRYLLAFDVKYRERRTAFSDRGAEPALSRSSIRSASSGFDPLVVDRLKREFYGRLDALRRRESAEYLQRVRCGSWSAEIFPAAPSAAEIKHLRGLCASFVERHFGKLDRLIEQLAAEIDLDAARATSTICWRRSIPPNGIRRRAARCWSIISAFRSGTC